MLNETDAKEIRKSIAEIEQNAELATMFIASPFGTYYMNTLDSLINEYTDRGDNLSEQAALRCYDAAKGARAAKDALVFPIKALEEGGYVSQLREMLRTPNDQEVNQ